MNTTPAGTYVSSDTVEPFSPDPRLLVRWFVQYNPLFTMSALCVLGGVLLLSRHLQTNNDDVTLGLSFVVELYQWLLIGTAGLLFRRLNEHRPGVILGIIAVVFLVDPTLQLSALAASEHVGMCALWVVLVAAKLHALQYAFCLRLSVAARVVPVLGAVLVAVLPNARVFEDVADMVPVGLAISIFVIGALSVLAPMRVTSTRALGDVGEVMLPRLITAIVGIGVTGALFQGGNAVFALGGAAVLPAVGAVALIAILHLRAEHEPVLWALLVVAAIFFTGANVVQAVGLPMIAVALLLASRRHAPRVLTAGLFAAALPSLFILRQDLSLDQAAHIAIGVVVTFALVVVLVRRRAPSALLALVAMHHKTVPLIVMPALKLEHVGTWGVVLVGAGFVLLPVGVYAHRRFARMVALDDERLAAQTGALSSSTAPFAEAASA